MFFFSEKYFSIIFLKGGPLTPFFKAPTTAISSATTSNYVTTTGQCSQPGPLLLRFVGDRGLLDIPERTLTATTCMTRAAGVEFVPTLAARTSPSGIVQFDVVADDDIARYGRSPSI